MDGLTCPPTTPARSLRKYHPLPPRACCPALAVTPCRVFPLFHRRPAQTCFPSRALYSSAIPWGRIELAAEIWRLESVFINECLLQGVFYHFGDKAAQERAGQL
jgi:hypothetical protein